MNRVIKFRAWGKGTDGAESQGMFYDQTFCHTIMRNNDGFEIMQFTGLLDKNGKEIYEGDVLNVVEENDNDHGFDLEIGEKVYFFEPLEKVISIEDLQKIMDTAEEVVNKLKR